VKIFFDGGVEFDVKNGLNYWTALLKERIDTILKDALLAHVQITSF